MQILKILIYKYQYLRIIITLIINNFEGFKIRT